MKKVANGVVAIFLMFLTSSSVHANNLGFGEIDTPPGVDKMQAASGEKIGIIFFISNLITIFTVVLGIWTLFNVVLAGFTYMSSSGDSKAHEQVRTQITNSVIGLILIVMTFTIGGLIGLIFYGDASFILSPKLPTAFNQ
jgi:hypothetical protein